MDEFIHIPRDWLTPKVMSDPDYARAVLYVAKEIADKGVASITSTEAETLFGLSARRYRTLMEIIESDKRTDKQTTNKRTNIAIDFKCITPHSRQTKGQTNDKQKDKQSQSNSPAIPDGYSLFMEYFNETVSATIIPQIKNLSDSRKQALRSIFKEFGGKEGVEFAMNKVIASDFLTGRSGRFKATFDWIFKKSNFQKIIEGNYDNQSTHAHAGQADRYSELERAADAIIFNAANLHPGGNDYCGHP